MKKGMLAVGLVVLMVMSGAVGASAQAKPKIAIVLKTLANPFWVSMKEGIAAEAQKQGVAVDVFAVQSEDDTQGQLQQFENLLSKNYAAIGFAPLSPVNLIQPAVKAYKKGIFLVNIDEKVDMGQLKALGGNVFSFITTDNVAVGGKAATYLVQQIGVQGGDVAILEGKAGNASGEARRKGAADVFNATANFKLVASQPADWDRNKALDVASNIIRRFPNLKALYGCNDTMALGALQAVVNAGKAGQILVVGTDGDPEAVADVASGKMAATVAQDPAQVGAEAVRQLLAAVKGKKQIGLAVEPAFIAVDSKLITK
jgi:D-allose transport system substrate-binding protein